MGSEWWVEKAFASAPLTLAKPSVGSKYISMMHRFVFAQNIETIHRSPSLYYGCPLLATDGLNHLSFRRVSPTAHCAFLLVARSTMKI